MVRFDYPNPAILDNWVPGDAVFSPPASTYIPPLFSPLAMSDAASIVDPVESQINQIIDHEKEMSQVYQQDMYGRTKKIELQEFKMYPTHVETKVNGVVKALSYLDFKVILDGMLQVGTKLDPLALPYNTFVMAQSASELHISCYYPGKKAEMQHVAGSEKLKKFKVALPNIIISHKLMYKDGFWNLPGYGTSSRFFVTDKTVTQLPDNEIIFAANPAKGVYTMPFPNFYDDGHMCFGGNSMPVKFNHNLRGLDYYYQVLTLSPFNNDLGLKGTKAFSSPRRWFEHLATLDTFNYSDLAGYRE